MITTPQLIPQIVVSGSVAKDRIMVFPGLFEEVIKPDKLHVLSIGLVVDEFKETWGGTGANLVYNLALLGEKPVLRAAVGAEDEEYVRQLAQLGVQTDHVYFSSAPTAAFMGMTDRNDCQIGGYYPGAGAEAKQSDLSFAPWKGQNVLAVISAHQPSQMVAQAAECADLGLRLCYDLSQQASVLSGAEIRAGIMAAELMILNDYELAVVIEKTGWSRQKIAQQLSVLVVTLGAKGCEVTQGVGRETGCKIGCEAGHETGRKTKREIGRETRCETGHETGRKTRCETGQETETYHVPAVKLDSVVDPTGAGDAFRAGFLFGVVRKWELLKAAQLGCVVAGFAVQHHGTQEHQFDRAQINQVYEETYGQKINF